jgi:hypothetical protein
MKKILTLVVSCSTVLGVHTLRAQGTAFTYQGRLAVGGASANGVYDFRFKLYSDPLGNTPQVGAASLAGGVAVSGGLFTTIVDFGAGVFTGSNYWLEVDVRTNDPANVLSYDVLSPYQQLTATPYAIFANTASNIVGTLPAGLIRGVVASANLSGGYGNALSLTNGNNAFRGSFAGNGASVTNVNAASLNGLNASSLWQTGGNSGTSAGVNFLGTLDDQPMEFHVNGIRALRLEPGTNQSFAIGGAPNVVGGSSANFVAPGVFGATIGGGGATYYEGLPTTNGILSAFGTVAGGRDNLVQTNDEAATIGGGRDNMIQDSAVDSIIAGGQYNQIQSGAYTSTIGGGGQNTAGSYESTISGGTLNQIGASSQDSTIGGGSQNRISTSAQASTIAGGASNVIDTNAYFSTIGGGVINFIATNAYSSTIGGGYEEEIEAGARYSTISGGIFDTIQTNAYESTIAGGSSNLIDTNANDSVIGGGYNNQILTDADHATIGGGSDNLIGTNSNGATIAGGKQNFVGSNAPNAFVAGGFGNQANGNCAFAAGNYAKAVTADSFVWSDGSTTTTSSVPKQFMVRASGGTIIYSSGGSTAGVSLAAGSGTWASLSDRNAKENFTPVTPRQMLAKVASLPISEWSYKTEAGVSHIGPMAQDFYAAFRVGEDDTHITTVDEDGVALAAIQGLNQKLNEKDAEIQDLKKDVAELRKMVGALAAKN